MGNLTRWETDPLLSAAEIVQDSADRMESVFRTLLHEQTLVGIEPHLDQKFLNSIDFHKRDLITSLGTTKWQLEDFERAVSLSGMSHKVNFNRAAIPRHAQFIKAIREQIALMEKSLENQPIADKSGNGKWTNLNEKDRDQLALFLTGGCSSDSANYDTDVSATRASGDEPVVSTTDGGSDEIVELKVDETPICQGSSHPVPKFTRSHSVIRSMSTPHFNHLNEQDPSTANSKVSGVLDYDGSNGRDWSAKDTGESSGSNMNHESLHASSRAWESDDVDGSFNSLAGKGNRTAPGNRADIWRFLSNFSSLYDNRMSRSYTKRRKDGETIDEYRLEIGHVPLSSHPNVPGPITLGHFWPSLTSKFTFAQTRCLEGAGSAMQRNRWAGSFQRKLQRIQNNIRYSQVPVRTTSMVFVTLGVLGLLAFKVM